MATTTQPELIGVGELLLGESGLYAFKQQSGELYHIDDGNRLKTLLQPGSVQIHDFQLKRNGLGWFAGYAGLSGRPTTEWVQSSGPRSDGPGLEVVVARTEDGGISWGKPSPVSPKQGRMPRIRVRFHDADRGWIVLHGTVGLTESKPMFAVWRSVDGGDTWSQVYSPP